MQQLAYLQAMDIAVWVRRTQPKPVLSVQTVTEPPPAPMPAASVAPPAPAADLPDWEQGPPAYLDEIPLEQVLLDTRVPLFAGPDVDESDFLESPPDPQVLRAQQIAQLDWAALIARVVACRDCELHRGRTQTVFGTGDAQADWLIVGEAPGQDEDRLGEPFVGRAGQLLNAMLQAIGLPRPSVYIANTVKCRPPANRNPLPEEMARCGPFLARQIALIKPKLILVIGKVAAQQVLGATEALNALRGQTHRHAATHTPVVVTYHPAYLLRRPQDKAKAWADLQYAQQVYAQQAGISRL